MVIKAVWPFPKLTNYRHSLKFMNKFLVEVSDELEKRQVEEKTISYVIDRLKQSFKTGAWVARQQAAKGDR
jgi:hypothetical protein